MESRTMVYQKEIIIPQTTVAGNIKDFKQSYEVFYYPKTDDLPDKIALYIYLTNEQNKEKNYGKRSIYFSSYEQLKEMIYNLTEAYFYFKDKRINPDCPRDIWRSAELDNFLYELRKKQVYTFKAVGVFPKPQNSCITEPKS